MEKIKLYSLLKMLSGEELKSAGKFLGSPFFNTDPQVLRLFDYLKKFHPDMDGPSLRNETLFRKLFPGKEYDDRKLRNLRHKLTQLLEAFLIQIALQNDQPAVRRLLIQAYRSRNAHSLFKGETKAQIERLENGENKGVDFFREMAWLHHELYFHPDTDKFKLRHPNLTSAIENLESYFTLTMLCYQAELISRQRVLQESSYFDFMEMARKTAALRRSSQQPVTEVFVKILDLGSKGNLHFEEVKTALLNHASRMNTFELGMALKTLINEGIRLWNQGEMSINPSLLELYKFGLEKEFIVERGGIGASVFINILLVGIHAGEFKWAWDFIEQNKSFLKEPHENTLPLCRALWHYHKGRKEKNQGDFVSALSELNRIPYSNEVFDLRIRPLQMRILYDSYPADSLPIDTLLDASRNFERYLKRNSRLAKDKKEGFLKFVYWYKKLVLMKNAPKANGQLAESLREELSRENNIAYSTWLQEKVEELG